MEKKTFDFEMPFGAKDSELVDAAYYIPEGMEAVIEDNKVVIRKKESEDEKIRKELLKHCTNAVNGVTMCVSTADYARWLAWLEKQKQVEWNEEDEKTRGELISLVDGTWYGDEPILTCEEYERFRAWLKKTRYTRLVNWSEEDETMLKDIIDAIPTDYAASDYREMVNWLKSLRPQ